MSVHLSSNDFVQVCEQARAELQTARNALRLWLRAPTAAGDAWTPVATAFECLYHNENVVLALAHTPTCVSEEDEQRSIQAVVHSTRDMLDAAQDSARTRLNNAEIVARLSALKL